MSKAASYSVTKTASTMTQSTNEIDDTSGSFDEPDESSPKRHQQDETNRPERKSAPDDSRENRSRVTMPWENERRKRADGKGREEWDDAIAPRTSDFDSEEAYQQAYEEWARHVKRRIGIDPENWPRRMNVSDTIEMHKKVFGISRSTFYRYFRYQFDFNAQVCPLGRKAEFRENVIWKIMISDNVDRERAGRV